MGELRQHKAKESAAQSQKEIQIQQEEEALEASRAQLIQAKKDLVDSKAHYKALREQLRQTLRNREQELLELQMQCTDLDQHLTRRKMEHPQEVEHVNRQMTMAVADAERYHVAAKQMREQVSAMHAKSLVDFRP